MATYYIDPVNGNDADDGLSWADAFLTLNGAEDEPVVAGDTVYVGPGVYRELLTVDVDGGVGTEIVYIGDVTGEHTDSVGGIVRITGTDNDTTNARNDCIYADDKDYRTFRGFSFDTTETELVQAINGCHHWTFEDCVFQNAPNGSYWSIDVTGADQSDWIFRRCLFLFGFSHIHFVHSAEVDGVNHLIENCYFGRASSDGVRFERLGDCTVRNSLFIGSDDDHIDMFAAPNAGHPLIVNNCIFVNCGGSALEAVAVADMTENYNTFYGNVADRTNVNVGGNSVTYPPLLLPPILHSGAGQVSGFKFPWWYGALSEWSQVRAATGSNEPTEDLHGIVRPTTASKNSWGPFQFQDYELESGTVQAGSYSRVLHDAGQVLARRIPTTGVEITVTLYMRYETNYAGNLPRMIIKQPGDTDEIDTMVAAHSTWEQLSVTFTPAASPGYVEVWAESRNTAVALAYEVFYDTMGVA